MKATLLILLYMLYNACNASAFVTNSFRITLPLSHSKMPSTLTVQQTSSDDDIFHTSFTFKSTPKSLTLGLLSLGAFANIADAAEEIELAELPPPYLAVVFAVVILGGVGILTSSLGDVLAEGELHSYPSLPVSISISPRFLRAFVIAEASLGDLSGAKAKKEMERGRSSYFKK